MKTIVGTYRKEAAILNYNARTAPVVVQAPDGAFVSGWKMSLAELQNVIERGSGNRVQPAERARGMIARTKVRRAWSTVGVLVLHPHDLGRDRAVSLSRRKSSGHLQGDRHRFERQHWVDVDVVAYGRHRDVCRVTDDGLRLTTMIPKGGP